MELLNSPGGSQFRRWVSQYPTEIPCTGKTNIFFQSDGKKNTDNTGAKSLEIIAKQICATCDLIYPCLADALISDEKFGIWGGMNKMQRSTLMKQLERSRIEITPENIQKLAPYFNILESMDKQPRQTGIGPIGA